MIASVATPAIADVREFLGRPLADVRVELGGTVYTDPAVVQLLETRVGEPLSMEHIRESIDHLIGLGRFEDVQVFAEHSTVQAGAVSLRWLLAPVLRIAAVEFEGDLGVDESALRAQITERFGSQPPSSSVPDIVGTLTAYYGTRGYRRATVAPKVALGGQLEAATLVISVLPGERTVIGSVSVQGDTGESPAPIIARLRLERGRPYDGPALEARADAYEQELHDLGYYEAGVSLRSTFSVDDRSADLIVDVERGPRVRIVFAGDPLPESRRDDLVPIRRERSVDLDLLEDASRNIEAYLRQEGYREAEAPYVRDVARGEMTLTFTVRRGPLHRLGSIGVSGNRAVTLTDITPLVALQPGEVFDQARVATVASAVTELYRVRGFVRAVIKPEITVLPEQTKDGQAFRPVVVTLTVDEGTQTMVGNVTIEGASAVAESRLRLLLGLTGGRPYYRPQLDADRDAIERLYRNEGFQTVRIQPETELREDGRQVDVRWRIREGLRTVIDHVLVSGNVRTSADLIRRAIPLQPGRPLGDDLLIESQQRLAELGLFRRIRIVELPHTSSGARDILVEVDEAPSTTVAYGGGLEAGRRLRVAEDNGGVAEDRIEVAPRAFFEVSRRNLWGRNRSITFFTRVSFRPRDPGVESFDPTDEGGYGFNEYRVLGTFREPRPFGAPGDFQVTGFVERGIRSSFNFTRRGFRTEYGRRFGELSITGRYSFDLTERRDYQIAPEDQLLVDRIFPRVRLSTLTASLLRDLRNDVLDPERGAVLGVDGTVAPRAIGSEVGFVKTSGQAFVYQRLPGPARLTLAAGIRVGFAVGFERPVERRDVNGQPILGPDGTPIVDRVAEVPLSERFFAGGDTTVRGFVLDRLGTTAFDDFGQPRPKATLNAEGFPTGGSGLAVVNLEVRTPYWKRLSGVGFLDAGNVFHTAGDLNFGDLRPAAGFGIRFRSPIGPLRFDLGLNLDRQVLSAVIVDGATVLTRERRTVFHISLGQAF